MSDEHEPKPSFAELAKLACDPAPEAVARFTRILQAHTPLDPDLLAYLQYNSSQTLSGKTTPAQARALGERFTRWWCEIKALTSADAETDARVTQLIGVIACGPDARDPAPAAAGGNYELLELIQWGRREVPGVRTAAQYCATLLAILENVICGAVNRHYGVTRWSSVGGYPFYFAIKSGRLAQVQAAANWCNPSPAAVEYGLQRAILRDRYRWAEYPAHPAEVLEPIVEWLFASARSVGLRTLSLVVRGQHDIEPNNCAKYLEFYRRMLFLCPALTPRTAGALLADPEWDEQGGWARGVLEEIARRALRSAWLEAVAAARPKAA